MSDFDAIDSLLDSVAPEAELPEPAARRDLREQARLSKAQVARALGVSPSTLAAWETGREPGGDIRKKYAYLLDGLAAKLVEEARQAAPEPDAPTVTATTETATATEVQGDEDVEVLAAPEPCVLCGAPAGQRVAGFAQHLDPAECQGAASGATAEPSQAQAQAQAQA
ncbi:helix-turn-helix transcriptional regulator, partial [Streptomyces sp. SID14478]|uniref:helix-turn-helix domain-containing protein n=1 Tax=Streptomyces sp. SID14478 TaxID=2706073 RepID=UPI0013E0E518